MTVTRILSLLKTRGSGSRDEDNRGETDANAISGSIQLTTMSEGRTKMREDTKLTLVRDTWHVQVTAVSTRSVPMTEVYVGSLTCAYGSVRCSRAPHFEVNAVFHDTSQVNSFASEGGSCGIHTCEGGRSTCEINHWRWHSVS